MCWPVLVCTSGSVLRVGHLVWMSQSLKLRSSLTVAAKRQSEVSRPLRTQLLWPASVATHCALGRLQTCTRTALLPSHHNTHLASRFTCSDSASLNLWRAVRCHHCTHLARGQTFTHGNVFPATEKSLCSVPVFNFHTTGFLTCGAQHDPKDIVHTLASLSSDVESRCLLS